MEGLFFLAMLTSIGACVAVAYDIIKQFNHGEFDSVLKRKVDERHDESINVVLMRADELDITP